LLEKLADKLPKIERYVVLTDNAHMPATTLKNAVPYEDWLAEVDSDFAWKSLDENTAAGMCYTSGTTGNPKGVLYSHRSNILHSMIACSADMLGQTSRDVVMPGPKLDGASVYELLTDYKVTFTAAVPTVWLGLLQYLESTGNKLAHLKRVLIGGSACPRVVIEKFQHVYGVEVVHAWGMTEMSPLGTVCTLKPEYSGLTGPARVEAQLKQGHVPFGVEMKITDDTGRKLPWDGKTFGRLKVRGPAVTRAYFKEGFDVLDEEGYFETGDVSTIDAHGYMQITDRAKDVIKSGGEWISSIEIENLAVGHPKVAEAAVIGLKHPKWDERPLLVIVPKKGEHPTREEILGFLEGKIAQWWMPDDVVIAEEIPHTATGKIQKIALRERFKDYVFPMAVAS
jgi:fatty-acyl-CoA synthase